MGYGWQPSTGNYKVVHYDRSSLAEIEYNVGLSNFTESSTVDGGSGSQFQYSISAGTASPFSSFGSYTVTLPVGQDAIKFGNKVSSGFSQPNTYYSHAYLVVTF